MADTWFDIPETGQEEFFDTPVKPQASVEPSLSEAYVDFYSEALSRPRDEVERDLQSSFFPVLENEATAKANEAAKDVAQRKIEDILVEQLDVTSSAEAISKVREDFVFGSYVAPDAAALLAQNSDMSRIQRQVIERVVAAERLLQSKIAKSSEGGWAVAGYWLDAAAAGIVHSPLGAFASVTGIGDETFEGAQQVKELAQEAVNLLFQDVSKDVFEEQFNSILNRLADAGLFTEENPFFISDFINLVQEYSVGFEAAFMDVGQVLDILSLDLLKGVGAASKSPTTMAKIASRKTAKDTVVEAADKGAREEVVVEHTAPAMATPLKADKSFFAGPELQAMREIEANNAWLDAVKYNNWGELIDPETLAVKREDFIKTTREALGSQVNHAINFDVEVGPTGNIWGVAYLGTTKGAPYQAASSAQKVADRIGGTVVTQVVEGKKQYIVRKEVDIPTEGLVDPTNLKDVATGILSGIMSTTARTTKQLDALIKRGEAQSVKTLQELGKDYEKVKRSVSSDEIKNVSKLFETLRDDPNYNFRRTPLTLDEFDVMYNRMHGSSPSEAATNYFKALRDINDVDYYMNADALLKEAINNKETMIKLDGIFYRSKKVSYNSIEEGHPVYDATTGRLVKLEDLDPEKAVIYEVKDFEYQPAGVGHVRYVAGTDFPTRRMYHTDVLGYNVGGHRKYTEPWEFFLKQEGRDIQIAGGKVYQGKDVAFMAVRFEQEAAKVVEQWGNIADAVRKGVSETSLRKVILANNDWNPSIEDLSSLKKFADEHGLDITKKIGAAGDGEPIKGTSWAGETTVGDSFRSSRNVSKRRGTSPLLGYGGEPLEALNPITATERGFAQAVYRKGNANYMFHAVNGWLKAAEKSGAITNWDALAGQTPLNKMRNAKPSRHFKEGIALAKERATIEFRLSSTSPMVLDESRLMRNLATFVYGKGSKSMAKALDWMATKDPAGFLRAMAFHTKLGMWAVEQVYVQASQLVNSMGIVSATIGPQGAIRGSLAVLPLRLALVKQIPDGALKHIAKAQAPFTGITAEDFITLRDWIVSTGRNVVNKTAIEENNPAGSIVQSKFLEYGQTFFNEGELMARLGAAAMNFLERRAKYPAEDIFENAVTNQMIHRQDILSGSMTSASSAPWQKSLLAVPLQFTTYHVRLAEQLFTDRILTPKERVSLGLTHLLVYGAAGAPLAGLGMDKAGYEGIVDPNSWQFDLVRKGLMDATIGTLSGEETFLSARLAAGEGLYDIVKDLSTKPLWEFAVGPGGSITYDFGYAMYSMSKNVFSILSGNSRFNSLTYDWNRFARNVTSYDRAFALWMGARYGIYTSRKTEDVMLENMTPVEVLFKSLGIRLEEEETLWTTVSLRRFDKAMLEKTTKEIKRLDNIASRLIEEGDIEGASKAMEDIGAILEILEPSELDAVSSRLRQKLTLHESVVRGLVREGHNEMANKLMDYKEGKF